MRSLPDTSTHGQHWESNSMPSDLESNPNPLGHMLLITSLAKEVMFWVTLVCLFVCLSVGLWTRLLKKL